MAETPLCAYAAVDSAPAGLVLTVLYRHAPWAEVRDYLAGDAGRAPFAGCSPSRVSDCLPRMSRAQVYAHLKKLREIGLIKPSREVCQDGVERDGFLLLARDDGQPVPGDSSEGCQQRSSESGKPDGGTASARPAVRKPGHPESGNPDTPVRETGRASPGNRIEPSGKPDCNSLQNRALEQIEQIKDDELTTQVLEQRGREAPVSTTATAPVATPARVVAHRPVPDAPDGQPVGGASAARVLLLELTHLYCPDDEGRRFVVANRRHLELAEQLLAVASGPGDDPGVLANERLQLVLGYVRDFAELVRADRKQEVFWRPTMLGTTPAAGKTISAWEMLTAKVDEWRKAKRADREAQAVVRARRAADVAEERQIAERRMDPALVAREAARFTGVQPQPEAEREETLRRQGRGREAATRRAESNDEEMRLAINRALLDAMKKNGGPLSQEQAEDIRRRVRGEEEAT